MNHNFSSMIDRYKHQQLRIGSVSPHRISAWANKILPNGKIVGEVSFQDEKQFDGFNWLEYKKYGIRESIGNRSNKRISILDRKKKKKKLQIKWMWYKFYFPKK